MRVEQLISDLAVQRFNLRILGWLPRLNEVQLDPLLSAPLQHRPARKLRAVVKTHRFRKTPLESDRIEAARDIVRAERKRGFEGEAFAGEVVDNIHRSKVAAVGEAIVHEVDRP